MERIGSIFIINLFLSAPVFSQTVYIPDQDFLTALIEEGVDSNGDGLISHTEAENVTNLDINGWSGLWKPSGEIEDLTGIEAFINLVTLNCSYNQITRLVLSSNHALTALFCNSNYLTSLDVSNNRLLTWLVCYDNQLTSLDVSDNNALKFLFCHENSISGLNVSNCVSLNWLSCENNQLTELDVSSCYALTSLYCYGNHLNSLDVSYNTGLEHLMCWSNQLTKLNVSGCESLELLWCEDNRLLRLDLSENEKICIKRFVGLFPSLNLSTMPTLHEICIGPSTQIVEMCYNTNGSPSAYFTTECSDFEAPYIVAVDSLYQPAYIEVTSSEDGMIYLVPDDTERNLTLIRGVSIDSVVTEAFSPVAVSLNGLENEIYWFYARDSLGNISEHKAIVIMGVGIGDNSGDQISIFPNPVSDLLTVQNEMYGQFFIEINSINGAMLYNTLMDGDFLQIDLSLFPRGFYFIRVRSEGSVTTKKIIKI